MWFTHGWIGSTTEDYFKARSGLRIIKLALSWKINVWIAKVVLFLGNLLIYSFINSVILQLPSTLLRIPKQISAKISETWVVIRTTESFVHNSVCVLEIGMVRHILAKWWEWVHLALTMLNRMKDTGILKRGSSEWSSSSIRWVVIII